MQSVFPEHGQEVADFADLLPDVDVAWVGTLANMLMAATIDTARLLIVFVAVRMAEWL